MSFVRELVEDFFSRERKFSGVERELEVPFTGKIVSIVGPRRAGKTWFFYSLLQKLENPMYVDFEDVAFSHLKPEEFFDVIKIFTEVKYGPKSLLLDEIQALHGWGSLVRSLHDRGYRVFLTGSSSKLLPKEVSTELRGRTITYLLLPFSFREFVRARRVEVSPLSFEGRGEILRLLKEYLTYGSYPEVVLASDKQRILREYMDTIFYRDFVERHKIKSMEFGRFLFEFAFQNFSREISLRKIKRSFPAGVSFKTLYDYVDKIQDTLAVFFLEKYSGSVYLRRSWPRKLYVCDLGISEFLGFSPDLGRRMENCVYLELMRRRNHHPWLEIFYFRDQAGEVDFVLKEGTSVRQLIQVTYASSRNEVEDRELKSLLRAGKKMGCENLLVITWDYEGEEVWEGRRLKFVPLWKWLLTPEPAVI